MYHHSVLVFSDHLLVTRRQHHKSRKWYLTVVFHTILSWATVNATIIYRDYHPTFKNADAKETLAQELTDWLCPSHDDDSCSSDEELEDQPLVPQQHSKPPQVPDAVVRRHRLDILQRHSIGFVLPDKRKFWVAHLQKKKVDTFCLHCGKFLCIKDGCFDNFHNCQHYLMDDPTLQHVEHRSNIIMW